MSGLKSYIWAKEIIITLNCRFKTKEADGKLRLYVLLPVDSLSQPAWTHQECSQRLFLTSASLQPHARLPTPAPLFFSLSAAEPPILPSSEKSPLFRGGDPEESPEFAICYSSL